MILPVLKIRNNPLYAGQTLLLVLLSMAVVLTIVLSILSRSVTDVAVTSSQEDSQKAFSAAEAGIESSLFSGLASGGTFENNAEYTTGVSDYGLGETEFVYPSSLISGEIGTIWFVGHDENGNLSCTGGDCFAGTVMKVCWGTDPVVIPAIEVSIYYTSTPGDYATVKVARGTADPDSARRTSNNFAAANVGSFSVAGEPFKYCKNYSFDDYNISVTGPNVLQFALVRMLYNTSNVEKFGVVMTGGTLPSQGMRAESVGTAGEATRKVEVFRGYSEMSPIFQGAIFNLGGLTKN
jgi:hypothetical protein